MAVSEEQAKAQRESLKQVLEALLTIEPSTLIREGQLGKDLSFKEGLPYFERSLKLFHDLGRRDVMQLPYSVIRALNSQAQTLLNSINAVRSFSVTNEPNPAQKRDELIQVVRNGYDSQFTAVAPWLTYLTRRHSSVERLEKQAIEILEQMRSSAEEESKYLRKAREEVDSIQLSVRKAAADVGVSQHSIHFAEEATAHGIAARWWLGAAVVFGIAASVIAYFLFGSASWVLDQEVSLGYYFRLSIPRIVILSVLFYGMVLSVRSFIANKHNQIVNTHRQNALRTFESFVKSADDPQTRDAVLLRATEAIFGAQRTGYLTGDSDAPVPNTLVEIIRGATNQK